MIHNVSDSLYYMVLKVNILFGKCHVGMKSFLTSFVRTSIKIPAGKRARTMHVMPFQAICVKNSTHHLNCRFTFEYMQFH